tara:strand:- start:2683 stop:2856 length:174 start_codon:yes stop_codon:yes gene_type:complete
MKLMKNKSFRISIKIKLIIIKLLIGVGLIHPIKHDPHIEIEQERSRRHNIVNIFTYH